MNWTAWATLSLQALAFSHFWSSSQKKYLSSKYSPKMAASWAAVPEGLAAARPFKLVKTNSAT